MSAFITLARTGDAGCSRSAEKAQADAMNVPRQIPSIMYSGQCVVNARLALSVQCPVLAFAATGSSSSCAAKIVTAVAGVQWVSLLMRGGIQLMQKGFMEGGTNFYPGAGAPLIRGSTHSCARFARGKAVSV